MHKLIFAILLLAICPALLVAQTPQPPSSASSSAASSANEYRGHGYVFGGVGGATGGGDALIHVGGGGERLLYKGFGIGGELGYLWPGDSPDNGLGVASVDAQYHFRNASRSGKVVPFVTGGYSLLFRSGAVSGANFGGGVNYWFKEHVGLRFEVRDHFLPQNIDSHFIGIRIGLNFR